MKISTLGRHMREGVKNVARNGWMSFASMSAIAISLFVLGIFTLLAMNIDFMAKQIENQVEIRVFLEVNTPESQIAELQNAIGSLPLVSRVTFVSKEDGLEYLREMLGEDGQGLLYGFEGDNNPLNDSFTVEVYEPRDVSEAALLIERLNEGRDPRPIYQVKYGKGTVETLFKVTNVIRTIGIVMVIGLAFTAMFLIANTIKLTIINRRREISIMKLVGATNGFIRWPFFVEGAILGIVGSLIPTAALLFGYYELVEATKVEFGLMMIQLLPFEEISKRISGLLLVIGVFIGVWGSVLSVRKFLQV